MYKKIIVLFMLMMYPLSIFAETCEIVMDRQTDIEREVTCDLTNRTATTFTYSTSDLSSYVEREIQVDFNFNGQAQTYTVPKAGYYELEVWGAQGGKGMKDGISHSEGGYGGYSRGIVYLEEGETLYVYVGGKGGDATNGRNGSLGGYNGGGNGGVDNSGNDIPGPLPGGQNSHNHIVSVVGFEPGAGGGGATHISKRTGQLVSYNSGELDSLLIVAGGGGAAGSGNEYNKRGASGGGYKGNRATANNRICVGTQNDGYQIGIGEGVRRSFEAGAGGAGAGFYGGCVENRPGAPGNGGSGYIGNELLTDKVMYCYNCEEVSEVSIKTVSTQRVSESAVTNYVKKGNGHARISYVQGEVEVNSYSNSVCDISCTEEVIFSFDPIKKVFSGTSFSYPLYVSGQRKCTAKYHYDEYETKIKKLVREYESLTGIDKRTKGNEIVNLYDEKKKCDQFGQPGGEYQNKYSQDGNVILHVETSKNGDISIPYKYVELSEYSNNVMYDKGVYHNACEFNERTKKCDFSDETIYGWTETVRIYGKYTMPDIFLENYTGKTQNIDNDDNCNAGDRYFVDFDELTRPTKDDSTDNGYKLTLEANNIGNNLNIKDNDNVWNLKVNCWYQVKNVISPQKTDEMHEIVGNTGILYRIIDLDNPFPGRSPGANWVGKESIITSTKDKLSTLERFEINLNSNSIKKIKEYNQSHSYEPFNIEINKTTKEEYSTFINSSEFKNVIERK